MLNYHYLVCIVLVGGGYLQQSANSLAIDKSQATSNSIPHLTSEAQAAATPTTTSTKITTDKPQLERKDQHDPALVEADNRRPIWNLAHMVNSIKELDYRLR